jgi:uncharacterized protein (TIGR03000 family)
MSGNRILLAGAALAALATLGLSTASAVPTVDGSTVRGATNNYSSGSPLDRRPLVPVSAYAAGTWLPGPGSWAGTSASPIFMTTINTPGVYGAYSFGTTPSTLNREPWFVPAYNPRADIPAVSVTLDPIEPNRVLRGTQALHSDGLGKQSASVRVRLPASARLYFEGVPTSQTGTSREFVTPPLISGQNYRYILKAVWEEDGQPVVQERQVYIKAGDQLDVAFLRAAPERTRSLQARPLPVPEPVPANHDLRTIIRAPGH